MKFAKLPSALPCMAVWGATRGNLSFIISCDSERDGEIRASVKSIGATPFDSSRHDLEIFGSIADAKAACRGFKVA